MKTKIVINGEKTYFLDSDNQQENLHSLIGEYIEETNGAKEIKEIELNGKSLSQKDVAQCVIGYLLIGLEN